MATPVYAWQQQQPQQPQQPQPLFSGVQIAPATLAHVATARTLLWQQAMNPLSIETEHLLVATITRLTKADDDFDSDNPQPQQQQLAGFGQIRPVTLLPTEDDDICYSELASLFVHPQFRHQGIATQLITCLLQRHDTDDGETKQNTDNTATTAVPTTAVGYRRRRRRRVCLLTLRPTAPLYERHGFVIVRQEKLPLAMRLEFVLGTIVSRVLGNELVAMVREE